MTTHLKSSLRKVPEVTGLFWLAKLLTTAMGEATSDFFANTFNPYIVVLVSGCILLIALLIQFRTKKYVTWVYWFCVSMVAVFGTMAADVLHKQFGVPYWLSTSFFLGILIAVFVLWYCIEKTLSIHSITSLRRELFYWATVMATFALGTAAGDWTADSLRLGYLVSGIVFALIIVVPFIGYRLKQNAVITFWFAYIITRPLGASFADWFGKPTYATGLSYGEGIVSIVLVILLVMTISYMTLNRRERKLEIG